MLQRVCVCVNSYLTVHFARGGYRCQGWVVPGFLFLLFLFLLSCRLTLTARSGADDKSRTCPGTSFGLGAIPTPGVPRGLEYLPRTHHDISYSIFVVYFDRLSMSISSPEGNGHTGPAPTRTTPLPDPHAAPHTCRAGTNVTFEIPRDTMNGMDASDGLYSVQWSDGRREELVPAAPSGPHAVSCVVPHFQVRATCVYNTHV